PDPEAGGGGGGGRGRGGAPVRVTKDAGMNRVVWDVRNQAGLAMPPAAYQARLTVDGKTFTQPFNVLIDPNVAADGVTAADLVEQFEHNTRMRELVADVNQVMGQVRNAQAKFAGAAGTGAETSKKLDA